MNKMSLDNDLKGHQETLNQISMMLQLGHFLHFPQEFCLKFCTLEQFSILPQFLEFLLGYVEDY